MACPSVQSTRTEDVNKDNTITRCEINRNLHRIHRWRNWKHWLYQEAAQRLDSCSVHSNRYRCYRNFSNMSLSESAGALAEFSPEIQTTPRLFCVEIIKLYLISDSSPKSDLLCYLSETSLSNTPLSEPNKTKARRSHVSSLLSNSWVSWATQAQPPFPTPEMQAVT